MTTLITLTLAGSDVGPFNLYSNLDGYTTPTITGLTRTQLVDGYIATLPDGSTTVLVKSTGVCPRDMYLNITGAPTTTTSTTPPPATTTTTTTRAGVGIITISFDSYGQSFSIGTSTSLTQSVYISAGIAVQGFSTNYCINELASKTLSGTLLGLDVSGSTFVTHTYTGGSGTWITGMPWRFSGLTIPLSINGGLTTNYANGSTVTIGSTIFTIVINKTCV